MAAALRAAGHVIHVVDAQNLERNASLGFHEGEIAPDVVHHRKIDDPARL
jgi:hypothetical protein